MYKPPVYRRNYQKDERQWVSCNSQAKCNDRAKQISWTMKGK